MNLITTQYALDKQRLEIYLAGCKGVNGKHCKGCHNPQSWNFNAGQVLTVKALENIINKAKDDVVKNIWILGGEPLDHHPMSIYSLIFLLSGTGKPVWLFTRKEFEEVPETHKIYLDYIKTGAYDESNLTYGSKIKEGINLASYNQNLYKKELDKWIKL